MDNSLAPIGVRLQNETWETHVCKKFPECKESCIYQYNGNYDGFGTEKPFILRSMYAKAVPQTLSTASTALSILSTINSTSPNSKM